VSATLAAAPARPRPIFCVTDHDRRDLRVADEVCAGRFTNVQIPVDLGLPPDWNGAELPADEEWRIEWAKFYYGLDLAHAFSVRQHSRYLDAWEVLVSSWIEQCPLGDESADVVARRILNWIYAWQRFAAADAFAGLRPGLDDAVLASLSEQVGFVREHLTPGATRNHRVLELYSLLIAALAFPGRLDPDGELAPWALGQLHRCLIDGTGGDGVHRECSTHYHLLVLRSFLGARENAMRFGLALPAGFDERLLRACEFALHCHRPDGPISALSDADSLAYSELLTLAATQFEREDMRWVATRGAAGAPPSDLDASFADAGYFTQRSGWGGDCATYAGERYLIFDCGPLGEGGHGHYDALSVEVAAGGRPLVVDPGRYTYAEDEPNQRRWFKGTAAHNTVCVDGLDQTPYRRGKPRGEVAEATFLGRQAGDGLDVLRGLVRSPAYEAEHERTVAFVDRAYWLIADELRADGRHRYDLRYHLAPEAEGRTCVREDETATAIRAPGFALLLDPLLAVTLEPGWVSPLYGLKLRAPVVSASCEGSGLRAFVSLIVPLAAEAAVVPSLKVQRTSAGELGAVSVEHAGGGSDFFTFGDGRDARWLRREARS
jgi:hypothetical protein